MEAASSELVVASPVGALRLVARGGALVRVAWLDAAARQSAAAVVADSADAELLAEAASQLDAYFAGTLRDFTIKLAPADTPFSAAMRDAMIAIPYGRTRTYGELAPLVAASPQAVGQGCGSNVLPIVVPCHRVLAAGGKPGGYSGRGGLRTKRWLLAHEATQPDIETLPLFCGR